MLVFQLDENSHRAQEETDYGYAVLSRIHPVAKQIEKGYSILTKTLLMCPVS